MIDNIEQLKKERPDLVKLFEEMTQEKLLKQCYLECIDAVNMEKRVSLFMEECTCNMSKTNYTLDSLSSLIEEKQRSNINEFCYSETIDNPTDKELITEIKKRAKEFNS